MWSDCAGRLLTSFGNLQAQFTELSLCLIYVGGKNQDIKGKILSTNCCNVMRTKEFSGCIFFSSLYFKHTSANVKCMGNKRTVKAPRTENLKIFFHWESFRVLVLCSVSSVKDTLLTNTLHANTSHFLILKITLLTDPLVSSIYFAQAFYSHFSECFAVLETDSRDVCALLLEGCCSKRRMSCEQRWHFTSQSYLLLFPEVKGRDLILFFGITGRLGGIDIYLFPCLMLNREVQWWHHLQRQIRERLWSFLSDICLYLLKIF